MTNICPYCENADYVETPADRTFLNSIDCADPHCDHKAVHFQPDCECSNGLHAQYCKQHGIVALVCHSCGELAGILRIARKNNMPTFSKSILAGIPVYREHYQHRKGH